MYVCCCLAHAFSAKSAEHDCKQIKGLTSQLYPDLAATCTATCTTHGALPGSKLDLHPQLMGNLDFPQAVEEIKHAAKWLREQGAPKVGLTVSFAQSPLHCLKLPLTCL